MALFRCERYPYLLVLDPRDSKRELARFRDGYFQTDDAFTVAELSKRKYIERIDVADDADAKNAKYRVEYRKCGRKNCHCAKGELHGPYVYMLYKRDGVTRRRYVGRGGDRESQRYRSEIRLKSDRNLTGIEAKSK